MPDTFSELKRFDAFEAKIAELEAFVTIILARSLDDAIIAHAAALLMPGAAPPVVDMPRAAIIATSLEFEIVMLSTPDALVLAAINARCTVLSICAFSDDIVAHEVPATDPLVQAARKIVPLATPGSVIASPFVPEGVVSFELICVWIFDVTPSRKPNSVLSTVPLPMLVAGMPVDDANANPVAVRTRAAPTAAFAADTAIGSEFAPDVMISYGPNARGRP